MITFLENPKQNSNPYMRFSKVFQPQQPAAPNRDQRVRAVQTAAQLLQTPERTPIIQEIQELAAASAKNYQMYYEPLIKNFAEFVQLLEHLDHPAITWLDHHLRLAKTALKMREQFLMVGESLRPIINPEEALWHYVTFSSALLRRIGLMFSHYQVSLCNEQGAHIADWLPFEGAMNNQGNYYKLREITSKGIPHIQSIHQLLARQLMPAEGFNWISKNPMALLAWLGVVEGESTGGVSHQLIAVSEKQLYILAKQEELLEQLFYTDSLEALLKLTQLSEQELLKLLPPLHAEENTQSELAVAFFDWLEDNRQEGEFLLFAENQYLLSPNALIFLTRECPGMFRNWYNFYKHSLNLGFTILTPSDKALQNFLIHAKQPQLHMAMPDKSTTELFHQTLYDHNDPTSTAPDETTAATIHQQNVEHTVASLNSQGLLVGALFGAAHQHAYTEQNIATTQHQEENLKKYFDVNEHRAKFLDENHALLVEREQQLTTRQQQLRRQIENQYPHSGVEVKSSFSYSKRT